MFGLTEFIFLAAGYLAGSISFSIALSGLLRFPDPRLAGSGNPGATNVARLAGKQIAFLTLLFDVAKTVVPMFAAAYSGRSQTVVLLCGAAAFIGHLYPIYHGFKGGKGVASFAAFLLYSNPLAALIWVAFWLLVLAISRFVALASILAPLPVIIALLLEPKFLAATSAEPRLLTMALVATMSLLIAWRHAANIGRMMAGTENRALFLTKRRQFR